MRSWRSKDFFARDFLPLTCSSLRFFLTWHLCIIILTFPKNIILNFHTAIPLTIELKMNVYKTYVHSIHVLFPGVCEGVSKLGLLKQTLLNKNILKVKMWNQSKFSNKKNITDVFLGLYCQLWINFHTFNYFHS